MAFLLQLVQGKPIFEAPPTTLLLKLSKMLMGNKCNWLLQGNSAITRVLAYYKILAR